MEQPIWMWASFLGLVLAILVIDLGVFNRKDHVIGVKESLKASAAYITMGLLFGFWVWYQMGVDSAQLYWTGFLIEKSLSLDNIFVIALVFTYLGIPKHLQHRVLFWGILGVIVLRGVMIGLGAAIVSRFEWVLLIFAAFLVFTGIKMLMMSVDEEHDVSKSKMIGFLKKHLRVTKELHGNKFLVKAPHPKTGKMVLWLTPLMFALMIVEFVDVIFAVDSVPAIFAITTDPYIVYTSNIFAILGLRALYFALDAILARFAYLKYALALVLIFIGGKVIAADLMGIEKIPASISLGVTVGLIAGGVFFSLYKTRKKA